MRTLSPYFQFRFMPQWSVFLLAGITAIVVAANPTAAAKVPRDWKKEWPQTDFTQYNVPFDEILSGGVPKDGIRSIDNPRFRPAAEIVDLVGTEPVVTLTIDGQARAYPIRVLTRHEIVNDVFDDVPVAVTFCPLCNAAIAFDRRLNDRVLEFGVSGKLRNSDLVMYDRGTQSWWQQFSGEAIVGELTGAQLKFLPVRLESWDLFKQRFPDGEVLAPVSPPLSAYGENPYVKYDTSRRPFLYDGDLPKGVPPMTRVVVIGNQAWSVEALRKSGVIQTGEHRILWTAGQNSALDTREISQGRDVGNIVVQKQTDDGWIDAVHDVTFAFVFHAFHPEGVWHL